MWTTSLVPSIIISSVPSNTKSQVNSIEQPTPITCGGVTGESWGTR